MGNVHPILDCSSCLCGSSAPLAPKRYARTLAARTPTPAPGLNVGDVGANVGRPRDPADSRNAAAKPFGCPQSAFLRIRTQTARTGSKLASPAAKCEVLDVPCGANRAVLRAFRTYTGETQVMQTYRWTGADPTKILTRREMAAVLAELKRKAQRSPSTRLNLVLFRLAACCGLRASEIASLRIADVRVEVARPHIRIRRGASKGGKPRMVPLWWDAGTLADLTAWKAERLRWGALPQEPFLASLQVRRAAISLSRHTLRKRFRTACKVLGEERLKTLTIHHGRHSFISHALAGGRTLAEVRDAAGHANVSITSGYLHIAVDDDKVGALFAFEARPTVD